MQSTINEKITQPVQTRMLTCLTQNGLFPLQVKTMDLCIPFYFRLSITGKGLSKKREPVQHQPRFNNQRCKWLMIFKKLQKQGNKKPLSSL